jgi:hypothetical protein
VNDSSAHFRKMVLRLHETDETTIDEKPIVETEEAGNSTLFHFKFFLPLTHFRISALAG